LETADWTLFANSLGYKELGRIDHIGVAYHIPPPGARYDYLSGKQTNKQNIKN
jgi:hexosaminidase